MRYMNDYDMEEAARRWATHPVLGPAIWTLTSLVTWTNSNSDGWAYWSKPVHAAAKLMGLIQGDGLDARVVYVDRERADATPEALKAALRPIKAFRTRQNADFEVYATLDDVRAAAARRQDAREAAERAELARLKVKYETTP